MTDPDGDAADDPARRVEEAGRLLTAAQAASDDGRPAAAARLLRQGLRLVDGAGRTGADVAQAPDVAHVRTRLVLSLAWALSESGRVEAGFALLLDAERRADDPGRAVLVAQHALMLMRAGRNAEALHRFDEAVALLERLDLPMDLVRVLNNRSLVLVESGRPREARLDLERCRALARGLGADLHVALAEVNLACMDVLAGDLPAALAGFARARPDYERLAPGRLPAFGVERARALAAAGLLGEADRELAGAVEGAERQRLTHVAADALVVRAEAALRAGDADLARTWADRARARFLGRRNRRRADLARLLGLRARAHAPHLLAPSARLAVVRSARRLADRLAADGLGEDTTVARLVAVRCLAAHGRADEARALLHECGAPGRAERLDTLLLRRLAAAETLAAAGDGAAARRELRAGLARLARQRSRFGSADLQTGASVHGDDLARRGLALALADGAPARIHEWSQRHRAASLLLPPVRPPDGPAAALLEQVRQAQQALRAAELAGEDPTARRATIARLQRSLRELSWSAGPARLARLAAPPPLREVAARLGDRALLVLLRDGDALRALVVAGGRAQVGDLGRYAEAVELLRRLRADLDAAAGRLLPERLARVVAASTSRHAERLDALLLGPVRDLVGGRELVVVPTGELGGVPWPVLPGARSRAVCVTASTTAWLAAQDADDAAGPALLVAGPGIERGRAEVAAVAAVTAGHRDATVLTGASASPAAVLGALPGCAVAHLAAHGHHEADNALFSRLELDGGPLLGYDLQALAPAPRVVVLSACELGLADVRPGDETLGMVSALLRAGTRTVVASVCRVPDDVALEVMTDVHAGLAAGQAPARALAAAQDGRASGGFVCFGAG